MAAERGQRTLGWRRNQIDNRACERKREVGVHVHKGAGGWVRGGNINKKAGKKNSSLRRIPEQGSQKRGGKPL